MKEFIINYPELFQLFENVVYILVSVLVLKFTGCNSLLKIICRRLEMKYKTEKEALTENAKIEGQTFEKNIPVYRLNKATGELEDSGEVVDIDALVNSSKETALSFALDRFIPQEEYDEVKEVYDIMRDDLDLAQELTSVADSYRQKFGLGADVSVNDVFTYVRKKADELGSLIKEKEKEVTENEKKKVIEESK